MSTVAPAPAAGRQEAAQNRSTAFGEMLVLFALICLLAAEPVPGVNESHYLPKAKHVFDSNFCPSDLFFQSHDSHGLAAALAGALAVALPLTGVAWVGRLISWILLAWAWRKLRIALGMHWILGAAALASWYFAIDYGNWAGEWAIGGFEGKSLAYPCIIVAFSNLIESRWNRVWVWLGLAVAWHPLAGGWAGLSVGIAWLFQPNLWSRAKAQAGGLAMGTLLGLIGVVPAALGLNSPNQVGTLVASQIHVYYRLAHHQCPSLFAWQRHLAAGCSLACLAAVTGWYVYSKRTRAGRESDPLMSVSWLLQVAWISVLFSVLGLCLDLALSNSQPILASQLLRFYWFRWSDIALPFAWTLTFWKLSEYWRFHSETSGDSSPSFSGKAVHREHKTAPGGHRVGLFASAAQWMGGGLLVAALVAHTQTNFARQNPAADDILMQAPATRTIESNRYIDWLAACEWARNNSPTDSLWFTPEYQQTFKWYAGRAEVVCWKDVPQDNASVRSWYERLVACRQPRTAQGERTEWTSNKLLKLARNYQFRWILVDRGTQQHPLEQFEIMYPIHTQNRSFAIFRIPEFYFAEPPVP